MTILGHGCPRWQILLYHPGRWIYWQATHSLFIHIKFNYSTLKMGRNRSFSRIGSLLRQATADVSGNAKAFDTTSSSVVTSVRAFSNNAKRTESSNITNTVRQALFRSPHGVGTLFGERVDMWDQDIRIVLLEMPPMIYLIHPHIHESYITLWCILQNPMQCW